MPVREEMAFIDAYKQAEQTARSFLETAQRQNKLLRLFYLAAAFDLDRFELDALLICLAPTLDLRYEKIYAYLQDHVARKRPAINLILDLLAPSGAKRMRQMSYFNDEASLFKYRLLKRVVETGQIDPPLLSQSLVVDKTIVAWLWGDYQPHPGFGSYINLLYPQANDPDTPLVTSEIRQNLSGISFDSRPIIAFYGPDRRSQKAAARFVAAHKGLPLLSVDLAAVVNEQFPVSQAVKLVLRDARLTGALPAIFGWDICLQDNKTPSHLLAVLSAHPGAVITAGFQRWHSSDIVREQPLFWQEFPVPGRRQRQNLWRYFLELNKDALPGVTEPPLPKETNNLADKFYSTTGQIQDAVTTARDAAIQRKTPLTIEDLYAAARAHSSSGLTALAQKIIPRYNREDLILPADQKNILDEIVNAVTQRATVLDEWGVGKKLASSKGISILFGGAPGTGKTMAAEVIARDLGFDLYKIDLSTLISKYIGETEKNLERIFKEAESSNAILFFDEADSLFGKRSEVRDSHDRYANIEVSYLLQRMEAYDGVTILATNLRANLDEAFTRRLHFMVNFPFPDQEGRYKIWQALFLSNKRRHADIDLNLMAERFNLAGGNIRNIIVSAAYRAAADGGKITMAHLLHSTSRELQKMGKLVKDEDMEI